MNYSNNDKLRVEIPIIVEGKYDKLKLSAVLDANIITTDGFGVFANTEKAALVRRLAEPCGVIVMTDSDGAGLVIRNFFRSILPKEKIIHLYTPEVKGKERRKKNPSKAGLLGVEGMECELLRKLFSPYSTDNDSSAINNCGNITKTDFYLAGLSGTAESSKKRDKLAKQLELPSNMSANALLAAVNLLCDREGFERFVQNVQ